MLDDEDFGLLMQQPGGAAAFGLFVALLMTGRERLQQGKAERVSGTDTLVFLNGMDHVLSRARSNRGAFFHCLNALRTVAEQSRSEPWIDLNNDDRISIRSFFQFNTVGGDGWGGAREGAGRRSRHETGIGIQDSFKLNPI
jgi:hypothetical protein